MHGMPLVAEHKLSKLLCGRIFEPQEEWVRVPFYAANHVALFEETNQDGSLALSAMYMLRISEATRPDTD